MIASIVHSRIFPDTVDHRQQQAGLVLREGVEQVVERILENISKESISDTNRSEDAIYIVPFEEKYKSKDVDGVGAISHAAEPVHRFTYTGVKPDFLGREREAQRSAAEDAKKGASVLSSRISTTKLNNSSSDRPETMSESTTLRRTSGGLSRPYKPVEHKAPIMLPFSQVCI